MPQPPSPFLGLQHIGLKVHDIEAALDFYVGKLGFTVTEIHPPGRVPGVDFGLAFLRCTALHHDVSLFFWRRWECPAPEANTMQRPGPGMHHIALQVASRRELEAWERHLTRLGVEIVWARAIHSPAHPEGDGLWGENHAFYISDPSGNCIEIFCDMALFDPGRNEVYAGWFRDRLTRDGHDPNSANPPKPWKEDYSFLEGGR